MPDREIKLSFKELQQLLSKRDSIGKKKKKRKRKKNKKRLEFEPIKQNPNMRDHVTSTLFPNTGASVLSREVETLRGKLNAMTNNLIKDGKVEEAKAQKSFFHGLADKLADETLVGDRNMKQNKDGSVTVSSLLNLPTATSKARRGSANVVPDSKMIFPTRKNVATPFQPNGKGDYSRVSFAAPKTPSKAPSLQTILEERVVQLPPPPPKDTVYMPTGDNIDVHKSQWIDQMADIEGDTVEEEENDAQYINDDLEVAGDDELDVVPDREVRRKPEASPVKTPSKSPSKVIPDKAFVCTYPGCTKSYDTNSSLQRHIKNKHK